MSTTKVPAQEFLDEAVETMRKRAIQRDSEQERSMAKTVAIFNAWTGSSMSEADGWRFMICLKQAREIQGKFHKDDYVDLSAYAGLLGEHLSEGAYECKEECPRQAYSDPVAANSNVVQYNFLTFACPQL